ncbi:nitrilase-related carbon-nitrogen hydrolase [Pseudomonas plecoglossicida]|uniref:Carbon-nitrogen hydrolase family protein n=1 Tax=Pseudomonas plecoglossicida TaxID=70775 RepID=A0AAD0VSZ7_PSEDL|nr:nitrilase-related carbon-nitrogen hydrolase [Pseudomonas plecoglossicida]AXM95818.1 carbon-nitrogen hydrolase family protein [Pseudomonas plecoglossicida]EPB95996.1 nitrilase/cyanide hydratase and apolipoprotein N-acyltransferase [Pseudomonas plecoglossicida NB2011]QLB56565.1 carbon-nitrogen hydrolase family protein [Pseudomonas plecoglossicida]
MRKLLTSALALVMIAALCGYGFWTQQRPEGHYLSDLRIELALNHGVPGERGNLLGIEPLLYPSDYQNLQRLHRKLAAYLEQARAEGLIGPRTVVVLPEHIGTWLWARGEKNELYQVTHSREAEQWLELSNPLRYGLAMLRASGDDRRADAHLRMKAKQMASDYQQLFGSLAREFGVTLVAGSIVLPAPYVEQGVLHAGSGPLFNSCLVFATDGSLLGQPQRQQYPDSEVRRYIHHGRHFPLQVLQTPAGRLGVLIGSDSWYPENQRQLEQQQVQLIANPAFLSGKGSWEAPWRGNRHQDAAQELVLQRGEVSEQAAWQRLTQAADNGISSMSVFMRGQFWEQGSDGQGFAHQAGALFAGPPSPGARLLNLWL